MIDLFAKISQSDIKTKYCCKSTFILKIKISWKKHYNQILIVNKITIEDYYYVLSNIMSYTLGYMRFSVGRSETTLKAPAIEK